jgi:hypothetical protein
MIRTIYASASHPDFVQAAMVFASEDRQTEEAMRAGTYKFRLGRPVTVRGSVVDADGFPIAGAKILVGKRDVSDSRKGETAADGSFVVAGCRPGKGVVSAEADGFAAATVGAELKADSEPVRLTLQRGKLLMLTLLSQRGEPVKQAHIWLDTMRQVPLNDPEYGKSAVQANFRGTPDSQGNVVWSNAPDTELVFDISAKGYMRVNGLRFRPDGEQHVVTLPPALLVSGTVRDGSTGEAISRFRIITGWPETNMLSRMQAAWRSAGVTQGVERVNIKSKGGPEGIAEDEVTAHWSSFERDRLEFADGKFSHVFEEPLIFGMANPGYMLKFEADGYGPFISRPIGTDEGEVRLEVVLQAAKETLVTVLLPDGRRAVQADVGLVMPHAGLELRPGGFSHKMANTSALAMTDTAGQFRLPPDSTISRVVVAQASGYAEASLAALASDPTIRLEPWGRVEGIYEVGGQPAAGRDLLFGFGNSDVMALRTSYEAYRVKTDQAGRFVFEQVPAGKNKVFKLVPVEEANGGMKGSTMHVPISDVEVRPGETTSVSIGGGYSIKAVLRWPDGAQPSTPGRIFAHIQTGYPAALGEAMKAAFNDPAAVAALQQSPEAQQYMENAKHFQAMVTGGTVSAENIPAGNYILVVSVPSETPPGERPTSWVGSETAFTVPAEPASGMLELGEIRLSERKIGKGKL